MVERGKELSTTGLVLTAALGLGLALYLVKGRVKGGPVQWLRRRLVLRSRNIVVVENRPQCSAAVQQIIKECSVHRYVGFDCEWVPQRGKGCKHHPVALLQLATPGGTCALFRLCNIGFLPEEVKAVLRDPTLLKVGVAPLDDARLLMRDFGAQVHGCLDLRFLHSYQCQTASSERDTSNVNPSSRFDIAAGGGLGLARMTSQVLGVELDKSWRLRCSNWEAKQLSQAQIEYAANDALVSALMFAQFSDLDPGWWSRQAKVTWSQVWQRWAHFVDVRPKSRPSDTTAAKQRQLLGTPSPRPLKNITRSMSSRRSPLYDNCYLQAPDGQVLCTCDTKKAEWYISKGLADKVSTEDSDSLVVRLKFEPSGRAGEAGKYYTLLKENICVVCGSDQSYIRKNVVPHEYRKFFPNELKDHSSHDVLLLCLPCSQRANCSEILLRQELASKCGAPLGVKEHAKSFHNQPLIQVRSAARALLRTKDTLPPSRVSELTCKVAVHYNVTPELVTSELLSEAAELDVTFENSSYVCHGEKVVKHFQNSEGIFELEKLWRSHFVHVMKPKHLPELWSVHHKQAM